MNVFKRASEHISETSAKKQKTESDGVKPALPKELTKMFQPLYCVLCKAQLSSPLTAAIHYSGRPHHKKIKMYLSQYFPHLLPVENQPTPEKSKKDDVYLTSLTSDQAANCRICNLIFTGPAAARSHYVGKKHRLRVLKGYQGMDPVEGMNAGVDSSGRFGIGTDFLKNEAPAVSETSKEIKRTIQKWYCDICNMQATVENQYIQHLEGKKHEKNCKKLNMDVELKPKVEDSILSSISSKTEGSDFSVNRTPSGRYYCKVCNYTLNSQEQFSIHTKGKKHKNKVLSSMKDQS